MTLPSSGPIYVSQVNDELARGSTAYLDLNNAQVRALSRQLTGAVGMNALLGKTRYWKYMTTITVGYAARVPGSVVGQLGYHRANGVGSFSQDSFPYQINIIEAALNDNNDYFLWVYIEGNVAGAMAVTTMQFDDQSAFTVNVNYDSSKTDTSYQAQVATVPKATWDYLATKVGQKVVVKFW